MTGIIHRRVLRIAGPIVLSNATLPLLGAVDTAVNRDALHHALAALSEDLRTGRQRVTLAFPPLPKR